MTEKERDYLKDRTFGRMDTTRLDPEHVMEFADRFNSVISQIDQFIQDAEAKPESFTYAKYRFYHGMLSTLVRLGLVSFDVYEHYSSKLETLVDKQIDCR